MASYVKWTTQSEVHVAGPGWIEGTVCGDKFDMAVTDDDGNEIADQLVACKGPVTCPMCIDMVMACRGARCEEEDC